jgi:predicted RNase H-like HicB family nuclease
MRQFTLEYWKDDDWYVGRLKEVPGVFSQGETLEELEENVKDAYRFADHKEQVIDLLQNVETFEKKLKAFNLATLLAEAETDLEKGRVLPAREFMKKFTDEQKISG